MAQPPEPPFQSPSTPTLQAKALALVGAVLSAIYLINPGAGFIEFIPDNIPIFGNLDEAAVTGLLIYCLSILGLKLPGMKNEKKEDIRDVGP